MLPTIKEVQEIQAADKELTFGRVVGQDKSVSPSRDTGFRMATKIPTKAYVNPNVKAFTDTPLLDCIHNDDMIDIGQGTLNGQPLDSVRLYTINYEKAAQRGVYWTKRQLSDRVGETCLCPNPFGNGWPFSVPCVDCGAGL